MRTPIRLSLIRIIAWFGGDRTLVGLSMGIAVLMGWLLFNAYSAWVGIPAGVVIWLGLMWVARQMFQADPLMFPVWQRSNRYAKYYPARASPHAEMPVVKDW